MAAYMDIVNTQLNIHGGLMFTEKLSDRKQSEIKNIWTYVSTSTVFLA